MTGGNAERLVILENHLKKKRQVFPPFFLLTAWKNNNNFRHCQIIRIQQQSRVIQCLSPEEVSSGTYSRSVGGGNEPGSCSIITTKKKKKKQTLPISTSKEVLFFHMTSGSTNKTSLFQLEMSILRSWAYNAIQVSSDIISSVSMLFSVTVSVVQITSVCVQN